MSLFAIADLHLSLGSDKPMDVFGGKWKNYVEKIKDGWYEAVSPEDTVVLIGDISWAQTFEQLLPDFALLESLPGRKIIIKGNHDYWWGTLTKLEAFLAQNHLETISFLFNNAYRVGDISVCGTRGWDIFSATGHDEKIRRREAGQPPVELRLDPKAMEVLGRGIPAGYDDFDTEFLDYILAVAVVDDLDAAIAHVQHHSTHHSDCIVTDNQAAADRFVDEVDSAAVYVNVSTRFTDGGEFGLGCEMGISTQKLHARGPMGLDELSTYKYVITGSGQIR